MSLSPRKREVWQVARGYKRTIWYSAAVSTILLGDFLWKLIT